MRKGTYSIAKEKARLFLIDNQEERDYLPWCIIAANLHPGLKAYKENLFGILPVF